MQATLTAVAAVLLLTLPLSLGQSLPTAFPPTEEFQQVCNDSDPQYDLTGSDVPTVPSQFSLHVEANLVSQNRTTWVHELFDEVNNRGKVMFLRDGIREQVILDYENNEGFIFPSPIDDKACRVYPLTNSRFGRFINATFGIRTVNGNLHVGSARHFLELLDDDTPLRRVGLDNIRGIPTMRWQACINRGNISVVADYYYTTDDWTYATISNPEQFDMTLTQIVVRGNSIFNDTVRNFYHVYSIIGFHSGPAAVPDSAFAIPTGLACVGRIPGIPLPRVPNYFSTYLQYVDQLAPNDVNILRVS